MSFSLNNLLVSNGVLYGLHNGGVSTIYCINLRPEEAELSGGRFSAFTAETQEHVVPIKRSRAQATAGLDWIEEFEAGTWSFNETGKQAEFSFSDYVTAVQFKLTLMDMAR